MTVTREYHEEATCQVKQYRSVDGEYIVKTKIVPREDMKITALSRSWCVKKYLMFVHTTQAIRLMKSGQTGSEILYLGLGTMINRHFIFLAILTHVQAISTRGRVMYHATKIRAWWPPFPGQ